LSTFEDFDPEKAVDLVNHCGKKKLITVLRMMTTDRAIRFGSA
jgi:hypothetical protein